MSPRESRTRGFGEDAAGKCAGVLRPGGARIYYWPRDDDSARRGPWGFNAHWDPKTFSFTLRRPARRR